MEVAGEIGCWLMNIHVERAAGRERCVARSLGKDGESCGGGGEE